VNAEEPGADGMQLGLATLCVLGQELVVKIMPVEKALKP
jgi:hypothetical protein